MIWRGYFYRRPLLTIEYELLLYLKHEPHESVTIGAEIATCIPSRSLGVTLGFSVFHAAQF
jgi:hypothetical protein